MEFLRVLTIIYKNLNINKYNKISMTSINKIVFVLHSAQGQATPWASPPLKKLFL
jgi:hypothetical protein